MKIFSFPHLVIDEIFKEFEPIELVSLSFCSKTAHSFVKAFSKIKDVEVRKSHTDARYGLYFPGQRPGVIWAASENDLNLHTFGLKTHRGFKLRIDENGDLCTYWEDVEQGCQKVINYVCDLFKVSLSIVAISGVEDSRLLDFIQRRQEQKLKTVLAFKPPFLDTGITAGEYSSIIRCNATEMLEVRSKPPRGYRFFYGNLPPVKNLLIFYSSWVTTEHLLSLESQNVSFWRSNFTTMDVCALLRSWLNGGVPKLKYLQLDVRRFRFEADIRERMEQVLGAIRYTWNQGEVFEFDPQSSYHIRRGDNVVATVEINAWFTMVVWPDMNGHRV